MSQFTLLASTKKGNKPDFHGALAPDEARKLYEHFYKKVQEGYVADRVKNGVFQAMMQVALVNDGPVRVSFPLSESGSVADICEGYNRSIGAAKGEGGQESQVRACHA